MMYPILEALKNGERFPYHLLVSSYEEVEMYWEWWWQNTDTTKLDRPYTIADSEPILEHTISKQVVDTESEEHFFYEFATEIRNAIQIRGLNVPREGYRRAVAEHLAHKMPVLQEPLAVFLGGGYGAGKTSSLSLLCESRQLPFALSQQVGVDYCKHLLPEFHRVRMVADGRASRICQDESRVISDMLFNNIVGSGKSLTWDSSMSDFEASMAKLNACRKAGYRIKLVAVWTPPNVAIRRSMQRARQVRRFSPPEYLTASATKFAKFFPQYADVCDEVWVLDNEQDRASGQPMIIAKKDAIDSELDVFDNHHFNEFIQLGSQQ